jgi:hypothetical protein
LLACALSNAPGPAIAEEIQRAPSVVSSILDIMNKASSGKSYAGAAPLTPVDGHRIGINCAAALALIHDPNSKSPHHLLNLQGERMTMNAHPDLKEGDYFSNQPESQEYSREVLTTAGTGFWTGIDRTSSIRSRESYGDLRGSMGSRSSGYSNSQPSRVNTAMTGTTSVVTDGVYDYERGSLPEHRPQTQFSELAGDMGLYDSDIKREMHVLQMELQGNTLVRGREDSTGKSESMLNALESAIDNTKHNNVEDHPRVKRRMRKSKHTNKQPTTYDEFIRVMLATPAQGAPSQSFNRNNPNLAELSHTVRQNWAAMPHYL